MNGNNTNEVNDAIEDELSDFFVKMIDAEIISNLYEEAMTVGCTNTMVNFRLRNHCYSERMHKRIEMVITQMK